MNRVDLAALARKKGIRRDIEFRPLKGRRSTEKEIYRIIARILAAGAAQKDQLLAAATAARSTLTQDDLRLDNAMRLFRQTFDFLSKAARTAVERLLGVEAQRHDERWLEQVNTAIGINLGAVVQQADVAPAVALAVQANVALITGLTDEVAKKVETTLITLITQGASTAEMGKALSDVFAFGRRRAQFIARDQAAKFNGTLNRIRQQQAGVTSYIWQTAEDERVRGNPAGRYPNARPSHWARQGKTFRWDDPPSDGNPGEPINCRCIARPVLKIAP